jgi:hypothetical protein
MGAASHDDRIVPAKRRLSLELKKTASIVHPHTERERESEKNQKFSKEEEEEEINDLYGGHERAWHRGRSSDVWPVLLAPLSSRLG